MKVILAVDLKNGLVVQGKSGHRDEYAPLTWGLSPSAEPHTYLSVMKPKYLYVADLDRIAFCGDHTETILRLAGSVSETYVDRGAEIPEEYLPYPIKTIVGTETIDAPFEEFEGGFLSIDIKEGKVIPDLEEPISFLEKVASTPFEGFIILNITSVGTECGVSADFIKSLRAATTKPLYYGGGIRSEADLDALYAAGFDGAIISTAAHKGEIDIAYIHKGEYPLPKHPEDNVC